MCLGALVDAGVPLKEIAKGLKALPVKGYRLEERRVTRAGLAAAKVDVILGPGKARNKPEARLWQDIRNIINTSSLPEKIKLQGLGIFKRLFEAESRVHARPVNKTHLHELGGVDCLVDIFGTLLGLAHLGVDSVLASSVNLGGGSTATSHGILPVPAPATAELLKGILCHSSGPSFELTTPTGAAILSTISSGFGPMPHCSITAIGAGAGDADPAGWPNLLRLFVIEVKEKVRSEAVTVIETNIDDMNPQVFEFVMERLFDAGAADVFLTQVIMKKSRPGTLLTVLCHAEKKDALIDIILRETTTIGVRFYNAGRVTMERRMKKVRTRYGIASVKVSAAGSGITKCIPEYEDCRKLARKTGLPLREIIAEVGRAAEKKIK
jgi:pyridinium-3,5-bisthiocarboxylic acid mononucleotide nickel chelatase